jgi:hypothetical protein
LTSAKAEDARQAEARMMQDLQMDFMTGVGQLMYSEA